MYKTVKTVLLIISGLMTMYFVNCVVVDKANQMISKIYEDD